jgi:mRNA-degrading endonuclease RelE of RelBE toxin-antitoxin system
MVDNLHTKNEYMIGVPELPPSILTAIADDLKGLSPKRERKVHAAVERLKKIIRERRERWQLESGIVVAIEPVTFTTNDGSRTRAQNELPFEDVSRIRSLLDKGIGPRVIAKALGVGKNAVYRIRNGVHVSCRLGDRYSRCPHCGKLVLAPCAACLLSGTDQPTVERDAAGDTPSTSDDDRPSIADAGQFVESPFLSGGSTNRPLATSRIPHPARSPLRGHIQRIKHASRPSDADLASPVESDGA